MLEETRENSRLRKLAVGLSPDNAIRERLEALVTVPRGAIGMMNAGGIGNCLAGAVDDALPTPRPCQRRPPPARPDSTEVRSWRRKMKVLWVSLLAVVALLAAACGSSAATPPAGSTAVPTAVGATSPTAGAQGFVAGLNPTAPWSGEEHFLYNADQNGKSLGTSTVDILPDGQGWTINWVDALPPLSQTIKMRVDANLRPLGEDKTTETVQNSQNVTVTVSTTYHDSKLDINAVVNGQNRNASVDVPADSLDNDQVLMTLRALNFSEGLQTHFTTVVANSATKVPSTATVQGKESVTVPAGTFDTWKVVLSFGQGADQTVWYQVDAPHQMVQYDNTSFKYVLAKPAK
jgi:hypothetical protein